MPLRNEKRMNSAVRLEEHSGGAGPPSATAGAARAACHGKAKPCALGAVLLPAYEDAGVKPNALAPSWVPSAVAGKVGICH